MYREEHYAASRARARDVGRRRDRLRDELIPGTFNVGSFVPSFLGFLLFFSAFGVEPVLLASMVISAGVVRGSHRS